MPDTLLGHLLRRLDQVEAPVLLHREAAVYPEEQLKALLSAGILKETSRATEVPRPARMPAGGDLVVRETTKGLFGVAEEGDFHQPIPLTEEDVRQYEVVISKLIDRIRRENDLKGTPVQNGRGLPFVGERVLPGRQGADVYLSLLNDDESEFMLVCGRVHPTNHRPVVILVLDSIPLSVENRQLLRSWDMVVEPLTTHLNGKRWKLPWDRMLRKPVDHEKREKSLQDVYCRVIMRDETRSLTKAQYEKTIKDRDKYGMFIDGMTRDASCRNGKSRSRRSRLTPKELGILADYIQAAKRMLPRSTKTGDNCLSAAAACRLFEEARRKADLKLGRYEYRAFRLHKNPTDPKLKSYEFSPPADLKYCLILPA